MNSDGSGQTSIPNSGDDDYAFRKIIIRLIATPVLGMAIAAGLLVMTLENTISDKLLDTGFYTHTIAQQNTYNRVYDDVLRDEKTKNKVQELLGDIKVVSPEDIVDLSQEVLTPEYLQAQVEGAIQRLVAYLNEDSEILDVYVEMGPALDKVKPTLLEYVDRRIDGIPEEVSGPAECSPDTAIKVRDGYQAVFRSLAGGEVPVSLPSIKGIPQSCRVLIMGSVFHSLLTDDALDSRVQIALSDSSKDIRHAFLAGDTHGVLKKAAWPLVEPLVNEAVAKVRGRLDESDRLDLIRVLAESNQDLTDEDIRVELTKLRDFISEYRPLGRPVGLVLLFGGVILMGLIYLPKTSAALRWPGVSLFVSGGVVFFMGKLFESRAADLLAVLVDRVTDQAPWIPVPTLDIASDLVLSLGQQLAQGFVGPALLIFFVGALLFTASIVLSIVKPSVPGLQ